MGFQREFRNRRKCSHLWPLVFAVILLCGTTTIYFVFISPFLYANNHYALLVLHAMLALLVIYMYAKAVLTDPGVYPKAPKRTEEEEEDRGVQTTFESVEIRGITVKIKWCETCGFIKPPRATHCGVGVFCTLFP